MLALVAWLKSFQYPGYYPGLDEVPEPVLAHVSAVKLLSSTATWALPHPAPRLQRRPRRPPGQDLAVTIRQLDLRSRQPPDAT